MASPTPIMTATRTVRRDGAAARRIDAEICVVGAGIAGISAALEAVRLGRKVVLVDGLHALGGQAVNSVIGTFCGFFSNGHSGYQTVHGIADGILRDLGAQGALHYRHGGPSNTIVVQYDEVALARWIERAIAAAGITVLLGAVLRQAERDGRRIRSIELATRYGDVSVAATGFVDATGDAALAWNAGLACREAADGPIYGTQMVVIEGIDEAHQPDRPNVAARLKQKAKDYGLTRESGFAFVFPGKSIALVNMTHVETPLDPVAMTQKSLEGKEQADRAVAFLRGEYPAAFGRARIRTYGALGIRQTRWIVGRQQLTVDDVRAGRNFPDAVARTGWPIELHDTPQGHVWEPFGDDHLHYVPMGSLVSPECDNMVAAGRNIDGDVAALSSVRVMGPCIAMGAAAAHALDLSGAGSVHQIDDAALRARVRDNVERRD
ncbi:MAG: FAD-dependent oxidoreductase [Alphaproteobacteria bacterium]|nr:MAG: FAD-dependent oxidoreductase [Alphaproteobacteria bacterium]